MKRTIMKSMILLVLVLVLVPGVLFAAAESGLGQSGGYDLDDLWAKAQANYDLDREDAVLLLESKQVTFTEGGDIQTRVHRVVWVGTSVGIRSYADLRIPWNTETSTLDVEILRTWRDGHWWPDAEKISETAVVHTLPHALVKAADYTTMRETMLLHDGVELGCIMETAYTITERDVPGRGGVFIFPQQDPAVLVALEVASHPGSEIQYKSLNGMANPNVLTHDQYTIMQWVDELPAALLKPITSNPEAYETAVAWSSWKSWESLEESWLAAFDEAAVIDRELMEPLLEKLNPTMTSTEKLIVVTQYLKETIRPIHYNDRFWQFNPRPAAQTLNTAYGHDLDRAVLASALLKEIDLHSHPSFISEGFPFSTRQIPRLQNLESLFLGGSQFGGCYLDIKNGKLVGIAESFNHMCLVMDPNSLLPTPFNVYWSKNVLSSSFKFTVNLQPMDNNSWEGSGNIYLANSLNSYGKIILSDDLGAGLVQKLASSIIPGIEVTGAVPVKISSHYSKLIFKCVIKEGDESTPDITKLEIGSPAGGISSILPRDIHLIETTRSSPVMGIAFPLQEIVVRINVSPEQIIQKPDPVHIKNKAGIYKLEILEEDDWLTISSYLTLDFSGLFQAEDWPDLRELLLEEADPKNRTLWFK